MLTDLGETKEIFDEVTGEKWTGLCNEHGFEFNSWSIEKNFNSNDDVYDYIAFLDYISDKFFPLEDE